MEGEAGVIPFFLEGSVVTRGGEVNPRNRTKKKQYEYKGARAHR